MGDDLVISVPLCAGYGLRDMGASFATAMAMAHGCCCVANNFHGNSAFSSEMRCDTLRFLSFDMIDMKYLP